MERLDLRQDFSDVYAFVADRVKSFDPEANPGPGEGKRVSRIDVGFGLYDSGWMCLVFDTRRDPEPDGDWNEFIEDTVLERPEWARTYEVVEAGGTLALILPDGTPRELSSGDTASLVAVLGDMLRGVLLKARKDGIFAALPKASNCELGVEEQEGSYGWPEYERRGAENLA
ncbi:hypothetical protein [Paludisphaera rhizosphaerae]|uniref:hypothetical protein n=1 Tax=Paludisphaera rhizosphaerae TaxID=2711216 RepID=UPI0013EE17DD|nr:hypothetical protein [Paludisphaera rhizosphaerae]